MKQTSIEDKISTISRMKERGVFNNYIEYMVFPYYKNLVPGTKIDFAFPLTVLVGKNGSGKSSTLHALYGAPYWHSCSEFWFSTETDPIVETGGNGRNRFFYGYTENRNSGIKEVMKTRMKRGSKTKEDDPDYWETSKPIKRDGMIASKRNDPVKRDVIYIDFRAEVSAFDKIFHFSKGNLNEKKALLRSRSKYLNRLFNGEAMRFPGQPDDKVGTVIELSEDNRKIIGNILGKEYVNIKIAEHSLFKNIGTSIYVKTKTSSLYSEANAGSGEVAVIQLVKKIEDASEYSLILLDEPEVSIHPGAQEKLKMYLLDAIIRKKLQIVISTHSPILIKDMPNEAIKLYITNERGKFEVKGDINYQEAFFDLEESVDEKKIIFCEDFAAKKLIDNILIRIEKEQIFDVEYNPGGEKTLITKYLPSFTVHELFREKIFMILDGDMKTGYTFEEEKLTVVQQKDSTYLNNCVKSAYGTEVEVYVDGGAGGSRDDQKCDAYLRYLRYYNKNVYYLPDGLIPELILLESSYVEKEFSHVLKKYDSVDNFNAKKVICDISKEDYGNEDHINDVIARLAYKWSIEDGPKQIYFIKMLNEIFEK